MKSPVHDWVECAKCEKWRKIPSSAAGCLQDNWYCSMNKQDPLHANCSTPEEDSSMEMAIAPPDEDNSLEAARTKTDSTSFMEAMTTGPAARAAAVLENIEATNAATEATEAPTAAATVATAPQTAAVAPPKKQWMRRAIAEKGQTSLQGPASESAAQQLARLLVQREEREVACHRALLDFDERQASLQRKRAALQELQDEQHEEEQWLQDERQAAEQEQHLAEQELEAQEHDLRRTVAQQRQPEQRPKLRVITRVGDTSGPTEETHGTDSAAEETAMCAITPACSITLASRSPSPTSSSNSVLSAPASVALSAGRLPEDSAQIDIVQLEEEQQDSCNKRRKS
jgi:hypothetical protein